MSLIICLNCSKKTSRTLPECIHCDKSIESSIIQHDKKIKAEKQLKLENKKKVQREKDLKLVDKRAQLNGCTSGCLVWIISILIIPLLQSFFKDFYMFKDDYSILSFIISIALVFIIWKYQVRFCSEKLLIKIKNKGKKNSKNTFKLSNIKDYSVEGCVILAISYLIVFLIDYKENVAFLIFSIVSCYFDYREYNKRRTINNPSNNSNSVRKSSSKIERNAAKKADADKYQLDQLEKSKKKRELEIKEKEENDKLIDDFLDDLK